MRLSNTDGVQTTTAKTLYTVGYEKRTVATLVSDLLRAGVRTLVDVRELPLSRRKGSRRRS
jgi:uncharacterized protein (DUF488 family)